MVEQIDNLLKEKVEESSFTAPVRDLPGHSAAGGAGTADAGAPCRPIATR
jgi:hypothetical protein